MSYSSDPRDPNYVAPGTVPPVAEAVEPAGNSLRWLWWLLGLLVLAGLLWALTRACRDECTALPTTVWTTAAQTAAVNQVDQWIPGATADHNAATVAALHTLCNARLSQGAGWHNNNAIQNAFNFVPGLEAGVLTNIQNLVNGDTFCRCS